MISLEKINCKLLEIEYLILEGSVNKKQLKKEKKKLLKLKGGKK